MIPKIIHYCWFGGKELPMELKIYINTWKQKCPDYKIKQWDETNFPLDDYLYAKESYENKEWAFVSDVARLHAIYNEGGIYLDTDVEVIKSFDPLLTYDYFVGAEDKFDINTGAAFGAIPGHPFVKENLDEYLNRELIIDGVKNKVTCVEITTMVLKRHGYKNAKKKFAHNNSIVFPKDYFSPMKLTNNKLKVTKNTYSIHRYTTNWKKRSSLEKFIARRTVSVKKVSRRILDELIGEGTYNSLKIKLNRRRKTMKAINGK